MRVLVATRQTNGLAEGDCDFCIEGELVYMQEPCGSDLCDPNGPCGCGRGFSGMNSHRATTTALVIDAPFGEGDVRQALRSSLEAGAWIDPRIHADELAEVMVGEALDDMRVVAGRFPVGSVVRRRLSSTPFTS